MYYKCLMYQYFTKKVGSYQTNLCNVFNFSVTIGEKVMFEKALTCGQVVSGQ